MWACQAHKYGEQSNDTGGNVIPCYPPYYPDCHCYVLNRILRFHACADFAFAGIDGYPLEPTVDPGKIEFALSQSEPHEKSAVIDCYVIHRPRFKSGDDPVGHPLFLQQRNRVQTIDDVLSPDVDPDFEYCQFPYVTDGCAYIELDEYEHSQPTSFTEINATNTRINELTATTAFDTQSASVFIGSAISTYTPAGDIVQTATVTDLIDTGESMVTVVLDQRVDEFSKTVLVHDSADEIDLTELTQYLVDRTEFPATLIGYVTLDVYDKVPEWTRTMLQYDAYSIITLGETEVDLKWHPVRFIPGNRVYLTLIKTNKPFQYKLEYTASPDQVNTHAYIFKLGIFIRYKYADDTVGIICLQDIKLIQK